MRHGARRALPCAPRTGRREEDGPLLARWPSVARSGRVSPPPRNRPPRFGVIARAWRSGCGSCRRVRPRAAGLRHPLARTHLFELRTGLGGPTPPGCPGAHTTPPAAAAAFVTTPNHGPLFRDTRPRPGAARVGGCPRPRADRRPGWDRPFISSAPRRSCGGYRAPTILVTMAGMGNALAARLAQVTALDERGATVTLGRFWDTKPVVLGFVRHFG